MKRFLATIILAGAGFVCSFTPCSPALADTPEAAAPEAQSASEPCFDEVCVGTPVRQLAPLPWQPVLDPNSGKPLSQASVSDGYLQKLAKVLRGDPEAIRTLAPYWVLRRVDSEGLKQLDKVVAVCQPLGVSGRLRAQYISADGYRTQVSFEPVASEDGGTQNFVVATITRFFSSSMGQDQVKELGRQIARKYAGFGTYPSSDKPGVRWLPFASDGPTLKLFAPIGDVFRRGMALRHHPACQ
jgi:hypothetical protein